MGQTTARDLPAVSDLVDPLVRTPLSRSIEELRRLLGFRGDRLDMAITYRAAAGLGWVEGPPGLGGTPGGSPGGGGGGPTTPDLTPPPTPTGLGVVGGFSQIVVTWDAPVYTQGRGHAQTNVYAVRRSLPDILPPPVFGDAALVWTVYGSSTVTAIPSELNTRWHVWIKWQSVDGVESTAPAGGTNGVTDETGQDITQLLQILTGSIRASELDTALNSEIALISGPDSLAGSVAARILAEATARGAAITTEASARATADSALASSITTLTASVSTNASAITSEAITRAAADSALSGTLNALAAVVTGGPGAQFEPYLDWDFVGSVNGWSAANATLTTGPDAVTLASTGTDPQFLSPAALGLNGARYDKVRARVKRTSGSGWQGYLFYAVNSGHGIDGGFAKAILDTSVLNQWVILEWDMADLTFGGNDWVTSTIASLRFDFGSTASDTFEIDWIAVGRRGTGVSQAAFAQEVTARATQDTALASSISTLGASVGANSAAISAESTARAALDGSVAALYTLRVQTTAGGRTVVGGFGLSATSTTGGGSEIIFGVRADRFYIGAPSSATGIDDILPFIVQAAPTTINGVAVPAGVYMDTAFIRNGSIGNAQIGNAVIDDAKIASLNAAKITAGVMDAARINAGTITANLFQANLFQTDNVATRGLTVRDGSGNIILAAGTPLNHANITASAGWLNSNITISSSGVLTGAGGGSVTLSGLGAGAMASINQITSANVSTYIGSAAIALANINTASITTLAALSSFLGTVEVAVGGYLRSGQTGWSVGTGWWQGWIGTGPGEPGWSIGDSTAYIRYRPSTGLEQKLSSFTASVPSGDLGVGVPNGGQSYGSRSVSVSGGEAPYSYSWNLLEAFGGDMSVLGGALTNTVTVGGSGVDVIVTGSFRCTVVDANGRTATTSFSVSATHGTPP